MSIFTKWRSLSRWLVVGLWVAVFGWALAGCGDDTDPIQEAVDEASFCRIAERNTPVSEASVTVLERLDEVVPDEIAEDLDVLRDLADRLAKLENDDPERLAIEFEVRFSDEFIAARRDIDKYLDEHCTKGQEQQPQTSLGHNAGSTTIDQGSTRWDSK